MKFTSETARIAARRGAAVRKVPPQPKSNLKRSITMKDYWRRRKAAKKEL